MLLCGIFSCCVGIKDHHPDYNNIRPHILNNKYINIILGVDLVSREKASQRKIEHLECIFHWMPSATTAMARNDHTSLKVQSLESQIS